VLLRRLSAKTALLGAVALAAAANGLAGCDDGESASSTGGGSGGGASLVTDAPGLPVEGISDEWAARFRSGDALFELPHREADGLGPLYIRQSCAACHTDDVRGPGFVEKMAVVEADGVTPAADQSELAYGHTVRPYTAAGATTPIAPPDGSDVLVTRRVGPPVIGRGYIEAIRDDEIERVEAEQAQRTDAIHGRINRVTYVSQANSDATFFSFMPGQEGLIGRFGLKARQPSLDDFTADAFQGDMGLTSPMRPDEPPNPDGLTDDAAPGLDIPIDDVNDIADYMRLLAIPPRATPDPKAVALFSQSKCDVCHVPSMRTRADYPIAELADIDAAVYTDLLLHDLGDDLADGLAVEGVATSRDWRTAPLIGLRFNRTLMHDGRAKTIHEAVAAHGGEATESRDTYLGLSDEDRALLDTFVDGL
jgi:CxxC motif-containing protein (DUF1111 family)